MSTRTVDTVARQLVEQLAGVDRSHRALLQAIAASPDDNLPRLVYADFLEERNQLERAFLIRWQCLNPGCVRPMPSPPPDVACGPGVRLRDLRLHDATNLAKRFAATYSTAGCPLGLRWVGRDEVYEWHCDQYVKTRESDFRVFLQKWICSEMKRIQRLEKSEWDRGIRGGRMPQVRNVIPLVGLVLTQLWINAEPAISPAPGPDAWHFNLLGWDDAIGVPRPASPVRPPHHSAGLFNRGFVACGEFTWPAGWSLLQVSALFARQPVTRVSLRIPGVPVAELKRGWWVIRRTETQGERRGERSELRSGVMPTDAFDALAQQDGVRRGADAIRFRTIDEADAAVARLEGAISETIRSVLTTEAAEPTRAA